nr:Rictor [Riptortus pedestris]
MSTPWVFKGISSNSRKTFYDPAEAMADILSNITLQRNMPEGKRVSYLNAFVKLISKPDTKDEDFGYTPEEILYCLRPLCFFESTKLKNATFRAVRHFVKTEEHIDLLIKLKYDFLVAREITAGGIQLCRRILVIAPHKLTYAPVRAIVAFAHPSHSDNLQSAALAFLAETALLNPSVFISCGGVSALIQPLPSLRSPKMTEALLGPLLFLANKPSTRHKSGLSLQCLTASVYMDPSFTNNKHSATGNGHVKWSTTAILCLLRSWTGLLHLCQGKRQAITSIVNSLYISHLQKPILEVLYDLLQLVQPEWTDEMSVALAAVSPSRWQDVFRISEGFVAAEASALVPHLAKAGVNLVEVHRAVVLYLFLEANLLDAIVHVIVSDDTFLSVHATILLGEILHLIHTLLPPELINLTPGLPNLISYSVRGCPINPIPGVKHSANERQKEPGFAESAEENFSLEDFVNTGLSQKEIDEGCLNKCREAQGRALSAILAMSCLHKKPPVPSLYLSHLISCIKEPSETEEKPPPIAHSSCDDGIKESGVMTAKDPFTWNWDVIRAILKRHGESLKKSTDSNRKLFLRKLVNFLLPVTGQYGRTEIGSDRKSSNRLTLAALSLISMLLSSPEETDAYKYLIELLGAIRLQLEDITTAKSAHDCLLSPVNISNSLCQDYFLFIGHLTRTSAGRKALEKCRIYQQLLELVKSTNHDCYIKLIVSTLDYSSDDMAREILKASLESKSIACRLYATKILHSLIRIGIGHDKSLMTFIIGLVVCQAGDPDRNIAKVALDTLQEATHCKEYVEAIVDEKPCLLRHGDNGLLLLIRCLSTEQGFQALHQGNFVQGQLAKWGTHYNYRYVNIVESLLATQCSTENKDVFLPPHLYQQLACHQVGLSMVLADPYVARNIQVLEKVSDPETDEELLEVKAALYSLSGIASILDDSVVYNMIRIATNSGIYSLRAVALNALSNVATSPYGVAKLQALGWYSVRHNRHDRWPLVPPRTSFQHFEQDSVTLESDKSPLGDLPEESMSIEGQGEDTYWGIPGGRTQRIRERRSATLPHNSCTPAFYHNRSYSESKAEQSDSSDYARYEGGRKSRSNSYTDSSTSGDSTYGARFHSVSEKVQTLSPIASTGSIITYHPPHTRRMSILSSFSRSSLRGSRQSILKSLGQPTALPLGLITYGELQHLSPVTRPKPLVNIPPWIQHEEKTEPDFSTLGQATPDGISVQSVIPDVPTPVHMGITLPTSISCLFPKEEKSILKNHVTFVSENLRTQGIEELKNSAFHKEICFLGPRCSHNTMINTSESESQYLVDGDLELEKEPLDDNSGDESSISDVESIVEKPMPIIFKSPAIIRSELTRMVEQLSNPILHKTCKQSLLQIKQAHGNLFRDICVFSDVCYVLSTCQVRIASRDFLNELFENSFDEIWSEAHAILNEANNRRVKAEV